MAARVVLDRRQPLDFRAHSRQLGRKHLAVRLVDLTGGERAPGLLELRSGRENSRARSPRARDASDPRGCERAHVCGCKPHTRRHDHVVGANVAAARANVHANLDPSPHLDTVVTLDNILDRDDGIGALRHDPAGRNRHRLAGGQ